MAQWVGVALSAFGAVDGAYGSKNAAEQNAAMAEAQGRSAKETAVADEETLRRRNKQFMGTVRASAAESGFDASSGSLAELQARTAGELELDALTLRYKGDLQRVGLQYEGDLYRGAAATAGRQGLVNASALIGSAVARDYLRSSQIKQYPGGMDSFYGGTGTSGD